MHTEQTVQQHVSPVEQQPSIPPALQLGVSGSSSVPQKRSLEDATTRQKTKVTRACDICKAKKSKCSGEQPCDSCNRRGLSCQYEAVYSRGRAPPPRRTGTPGQVRAGGQHVGAEHSRAPRAPLYSHPILDNEADVSESNSPSMNALASKAPPTRNVDAMQDVPSRGSPGLEVAGQYSDPTSGLSFLHRAWRRISNNENSQVVNSELGSVEDSQLLASAGDKPFQEKGELRMPSLDKSRDLLSMYFDVCIATYRLLHRTTVESWLEKVSQNVELNKPLSFGVGRAKAAVVLSVLAVASFHEEKTRGSSNVSTADEDVVQSQSDKLFSEASRLTEGETGIPRLESAQSRLVQVLYLLMSCRFNQAWYTFGHTLQITSALGLYRRDDRTRHPTCYRRDYIEEQCRKRTFWVTYTLDKYLGVIFGRPRHYHDDDIDQDFPDSVNDEDMSSSGPQVSGTDDCYIDSLVCHAKLAQIAENISREVYSIKLKPDHERLAASHRLGAELRQWKVSLPPFLGAINPSSLIPSFRRQATALKLSYCHAVILTHRPFLLKNTTRKNDESRSLAREGLSQCISAAHSVLEVVDRMAREGRLFHAFWWTHYVCFCALVVVYVWAIQESDDSTTLDERRTILDQAERCLQHLAQATASNSPSRKYSIILQELRAEAKSKTARALLEQAQVLPASGSLDGGSAVETTIGFINQPPKNGLEATIPTWPPLFGSPIETVTPGLQNFWENWETTDWLQLDSSAFAAFPDSESLYPIWMNNIS